VTPAEIGKFIAADIKANGHYKDDGAPLTGRGMSCVIINPHWNHLDVHARDEFSTAVCKRAGLPVVNKIRYLSDDTTASYVSTVPITEWNDRTPTPDVIAVLEDL